MEKKTKNMQSHFQKLIKSKKFLINNRFLVKLSMVDTGVTEKTFLVVVQDLIQTNFKMQFFTEEEEVNKLIKMLYLL
jgi:hypothetical protein